ncbi:DUF6144 family protein [Christensenellaceae bacterium OttesenSCG-928-K19]|nr:DUF6144 family protein [Christensenellaceae bacterium OttesenSCG-928-K19]
MFDIRKIQEQVLYENVKAAGGEETANYAVYGGAKGESDVEWVNGSMRRLQEKFNEKEVREIRMRCQCGYGMQEKKELVERLFCAADDLESFANCEEAKAAGLFAEEGQLYLQFPFCPCPMLAKVEKLDNMAWCQCTTGYSKVLFEDVFGCEVEVELLKSVKAGDEICLMRITPEKAIFHK